MKKLVTATVLDKLMAFDKGYGVPLCGIDEAGRGALAGSVYAAAVYLKNADTIVGLDDSKKLSEKKREEVFSRIVESGSIYGVGVSDVAEIAKFNILGATMLACKRAYGKLLDNLKIAAIEPIELAIMDGNTSPNLPIKTCCVVSGDANSASVAAASVVAKVLRDRYMRELALKYPEYGFEKHKGYGTIMHRNAIKKYGVCIEHRELFIRKIV